MTAPRKRRVFPFTAVIGQEEMKLALLLNVIDPRIGGVMIMGDRAPETTSGKTLFGRGNESLPFYAGEYDKFHKSHFKN